MDLCNGLLFFMKNRFLVDVQAAVLLSTFVSSGPIWLGIFSGNSSSTSGIIGSFYVGCSRIYVFMTNVCVNRGNLQHECNTLKYNGSGFPGATYGMGATL